MCRKCDSNHYPAEQNETYIECRSEFILLVIFEMMYVIECDESCKGGCTTDGPIGCAQCRNGWTMDVVHGCKGALLIDRYFESYFSSDIDECVDNPCDESGNYACVNTPGSYNCVCREGYRLLDGQCQVDIIG